MMSLLGEKAAQEGIQDILYEKRDSQGAQKVIGMRLEEANVLYPVAPVSSIEEHGTSVVFSSSGEYYMVRKPMPKVASAPNGMPTT